MVSESHSSFDKSVRNEKTGQLFHEPMSKNRLCLERFLSQVITTASLKEGKYF